MLITNSSISKTRGFSPFFLTYFKHPNFPFQDFNKQNPLYQDNSNVTDLINKYQKYISTAASNSLNSFEAYTSQFDNKSTILKFELGDLIYIHTTQRGSMHHKFANRFKGPYVIVAFLGNNNLQLKPLHGGKTIRVHKNNCKKGTCAILPYDETTHLMTTKLGLAHRLMIINQQNFIHLSLMMMLLLYH